MTSLTDDELMARAAAGDEAAFAELYERYHRPVFAFLLHLTGGGRATAEDLLQEAFLRAWRGRADYRPAGEFRAWLFTITRRLAVDWFRRQGPAWESSACAADAPAPAEAPDRRAEARDELARLRRALERLSPAQREVVLLARLAGARPEEIARVTGSTPGAVRVQLHRALRRLHALLGGTST